MISICTLAQGREAHLANLIEGLSRSTRQPLELVIAVMQDEEYDVPETRFPIRQIVVGQNGLTLSEARNLAARGATGDWLVFLDVDCIPAPGLLEDYAAALGSGAGGVLMGEVAYLPKGATKGGLDFTTFDRIGVKHSERPGPPDTPLKPCADYRCFWSLNFAMTRQDFDHSGGFDERFAGYGGEDTDFGRVCVSRGLPLWWVKGAKAFHQYHPHHMPPVHHLDSVLENAGHFADKWGEPTMQHWLRAFVLMGLIERTGDGWRKLRDPEEADLALTRQQEDQPYASSATVLEQLEREAKAAAPAMASA